MSTTMPPSRLDANQVLQGSYDEDRGRLRVDSEATVVNADIDVNLDASEDSVAVADPDGDFLEINTDGSVNVIQKTDWDEIVTTFPASNVELYTYKLSSVVIRTITVTYETSAKKTIVSIQKTSF